jgi:hypothetical protein
MSNRYEKWQDIAGEYSDRAVRVEEMRENSFRRFHLNGIKMIVGDWYVDVDGCPTREITCR